MTARRRSGISLPGGVVTLLLGCLAWQVLANYGVTARLLSSPWDIGTAIVTLQVARSPQLYVHILSSMLRTLIATGLGVALGFGLGLFAARRAPYLISLMAFIAAIPGLIWLQMSLLVVGFGDRSVILVGTLMAITPMMTHTEKGVTTVRREFDWSARLMGADVATRRYEVLLMAALPSLLTGFRMAFARAWRAVLVAEYVGGVATGLGLVVLTARDVTNVDIIYAGLLLMGAIFFFIERWAIRPLEDEIAQKWGHVPP